MPLVSTNNLVKIYESDEAATIALDGVDLEITEGEYLAVIGPSGSGKSTLLQILGCLDRPTSGSYFFNGKDVLTMTDDGLATIRNKSIGFVFQSFNLLPRLSVIENIKLPLVYTGIKEPERTEIAARYVNLVGLKDRMNFPTMKLSGGQKQRVAIARALINEPKIIFADEPTGSLDSKSGTAILNFLDDLNKEGHTIVMVTHESYVAERARRLLHIKDGKVERDERIKNEQ